MSLTPRDALATAVAAVAVLVYAGNAAGTWYLGSNRWAIGTMALAGIAGCSLGARIDRSPTPVVALLGVLGASAGAIAVAGLATGRHGLLLALLIVQLALWAATTARHAAVRPPHAAS